MSVSLSLDVDNVKVVGSPFELAGMPRQRVNFDIDQNLGVFEMDVVKHKYFGLGATYATFTRDITLTPPGVRTTQYGLAIMHSQMATAKFMDREWVDVKQGEFYFTYNPGVNEMHRFKANQAMKMHFLEIHPAYVDELLMDVSPARNTPLWDFKNSAINGEFAGAGGSVTMSAFYQIIRDIFNCPLDGSLGDLMLESSLQQLLATQFAMMGEQQQNNSIHHRDQELFYAIKDHLRASFQQEHSLLTLSRKFGVNQNKLKTGFRELFGTPVITYLYDLKMDYARTLLLDKGMNVGEVAPIVGYRNANHFSTAFKRKFGVNPSRLKR
jgi:AraC-like DNA-binding protein